MKVLIFGSNGLVGSNIAMKLEDSKENIEVEINKLKTYYFNLFLKFFNNDDKIYI